MSEKTWEFVDEIAGGPDASGDAEILLQKGLYHFDGDDDRPAEEGFRVVWRDGDGSHSRAPRADELAAIEALFAAARSKGWG